MNKQITAVLLNIALSLVVFTLIWFLLKRVFKIESNIVVILTTVILTKLICPTISTFQTLSGEQLQLKSIFSKKAYIISNNDKV